MRRCLPVSIALVSTLLLAGCATRQQQPPVAETPVIPQPSPTEPRLLIGLSAQVLVGHFGNPALQVREGDSIKLQFRTPRCVLDAYLYPQGGTYKVAHVDTRTAAGSQADQATCISELDRRS
jgi:hypothetical protein